MTNSRDLTNDMLSALTRELPALTGEYAGIVNINININAANYVDSRGKNKSGENNKFYAEQAVNNLEEFYKNPADIAVDEIKSASGKKIAKWVSAKLDSPSNKRALRDFENSPESEGKKIIVMGVLTVLFEESPELIFGIIDLLKEAGHMDNSSTQQTVQMGHGNSSVQNIGSDNKIQ